jgi:hypothetical protein
VLCWSEEDLETIFGDSPVEEDKEGQLRQDDETVLAPKEKYALDESSHLSTLTIVVLKEKLRKAGLPVRAEELRPCHRLELDLGLDLDEEIPDQ